METQKALSKKAIIGGWILSGIAILFLLIDSIGKFLKPEEVIKGTVELGYQESVLPTLGIVLLVSTLLYSFPKVSLLGAILLTGYLGGAIATHVRLNNPVFSHILFPVYLALFIWLGLYLRNNKLRELF
jgi:hypothetical protein